MSALTITIPLAAEGKGRARSGRGNHYTPAATRAYEKAVAQYAALFWRHRQMIAGPVRVDITAEYAPPRSWSKTRRAAAIGQPKVCKPDGDNIQKSLLDAMNKIAFGDDAQVAEWSGRKVWAEQDCVTITIEEIA